LIADIEVFNKQEGQHLKMHAEFLDMVERTYPRIREFEAAFEADLMHFLETESLAWNLAYCEGFESAGAAMAEGWINGEVAAMCGDRGSAAMELWMWHLAEEFEHRSVVHDVLHRLYRPEEAFALRTSGADFARGHFSQHSVAAATYLHEVNRASMTDVEVAASQERELAAWTAMGEIHGERLQWVYDPDYDPATIADPRDYEAVLRRYASV
jgi:predicted metal-dependent hydrolase